MPTKSIQYVGYGGRTIIMTLTQTAQDIGANTSTVHWTIATSGGSSNYYYTGIKAYINGTTIYDKEQSYQVHSFPSARGSVEGDVTITHNQSGDASVNFAMSAMIYTGTYHDYAETINLDRIPRVSDLTLSASTIYAGGQITATATKKSQSFTDVITLAFGNHTQLLTSGTPYTLPLSWLDAIPNAAEGLATVQVTTSQSGVIIGTNSAQFKVLAPTSAKPTFSTPPITVVDTAQLPAAFAGKKLQRLSKLGVTVNASAKYGASITSTQITADGTDYYGDGQIILNPINELTNGNAVLKINAADSRGLNADEITATVAMIAYAPPDITDASVTMSDGTATINVTGKISPVDNANAKRLEILYKNANAETWTTAAVYTGSSISYDFDITVDVTNLDDTETYDFKAILSDSASQAGIVPNDIWTTATGILCMSAYAGGKGLALFGEATENGFVVNGDTKFKGSVKVGNDGTAFKKLDFGRDTINFVPGYSEVTVQFNVAFTQPPDVFVSSIFGSSPLVCQREKITATSFVASVQDLGAAGEREFSWLAIGE